MSYRPLKQSALVKAYISPLLKQRFINRWPQWGAISLFIETAMEKALADDNAKLAAEAEAKQKELYGTHSDPNFNAASSRPNSSAQAPTRQLDAQPKQPLHRRAGRAPAPQEGRGSHDADRSRPQSKVKRKGKAGGRK